MSTTLTSKNVKVVPVNTCVPYDKNPRRGDLAAIKESLQGNGQFKPIVVRQDPFGPAGESWQILAGNHTWNAAKDLGWDKITVVVVEADDTQAKRIVIADNRTSDLGTYDDAQLVALLKDLGNDNLEGTAWSLEDLTELRRLTGDLAADQEKGLEDALGKAPEHDPHPAPEGADPDDQYRFAVHFACTADERTTVQRALNHVKDEHGVDSSNEALVILAETYISDHMEAT